MSSRTLRAGPLWAGALVTLSFAAVARADDPPPPPPPPADAAPAAPPLDDAEQKKLLDELKADEKPADAVPDLTKVNLAAGVPGAASVNPDMSIILDVAGAAFGDVRRGQSPTDAPLMTGGHDPV